MDGMGRKSRERQQHKSVGRSWPQRFLIVFNSLLVVACLGAAFALTQVRSTIEDIPSLDIGSSLAGSVSSEEQTPRNILIIGTDSAERMDPDSSERIDRPSGVLTDVIMVLRVDPANSTAQLISIPRDSRIELAPSGRMSRINAAHGGTVNGQRDLIQTIKINFGIPIDNYVEIDFQAFQDLIEVLGGVPIYFSTPVRDKKVGLHIEFPGCHVLDPESALAYARSREMYFEIEEGRWRADPTGDVGRINRQQDFIKRALSHAAHKGLRNPGTALGVVNAAKSAVIMDDTLDVGTLLSLVDSFRSFSAESLESEQIPTRSAPRSGIAYQDIVWDEALPILEKFWGPGGDQLTPQNVIVDIRSRSVEDEQLEQIATQLDDAGFDAEFLDMTAPDRRTTIRYGTTGGHAALLLAAQLEEIPELELDDSIVGNRILLSVGNDFAGVRSEALTPEQLPEDDVMSVRLHILSEAQNAIDEDAATNGAGDATNDERDGDPNSNGVDANSEDNSASDSEDTDSDSDTNSGPSAAERLAELHVPVDPEKAALCR